MVGNYELRDLVAQYNASSYFHHFVYRGDIVPRLLMGREAPKQAYLAAKAALASARECLTGTIAHGCCRDRSREGKSRSCEEGGEESFFDIL